MFLALAMEPEEQMCRAYELEASASLAMHLDSNPFWMKL